MLQKLIKFQKNSLQIQTYFEKKKLKLYKKKEKSGNK